MLLKGFLLLERVGELDCAVIPQAGGGRASSNRLGDSILPIRPKVINPQRLEYVRRTSMTELARHHNTELGEFCFGIDAESVDQILLVRE